MSHWCPFNQSILLTQGPICEIFSTIAQLLVVVEKVSFFYSAILIFFFCLIPVQINHKLMGLSMDGTQSHSQWYKILSEIARFLADPENLKGFLRFSDLYKSQTSKKKLKHFPCVLKRWVLWCCIIHCKEKIGDLPWNPWDLIIVCL